LLFSAIVIGQVFVSCHLYLVLTKKERKVTQILVNSRLYRIERFSNGNSFTSFYCISKEFKHSSSINGNVRLLRLRCFKENGKTWNVLSLILFRDISRCGRHAWDKENKKKIKKKKFKKKKKKKTRDDLKAQLLNILNLWI